MPPRSVLKHGLSAVTACDSSPCPGGRVVVEHESVSPGDATKYAQALIGFEATQAAEHDLEREMDEAQREIETDMLTYRANETLEEQRDAEEAYKDAVRSCILAGNNETLCELDPDDPYGTEGQT